MINWWNSMDLTGQIFALIAIPSTLVLLVQSVMLIFGAGAGDGGLDLDGDGIPDTPGSEGDGDGGLALFSLRGIMSMAAVAGWSGLVMHEAEIPLVLTVSLAAAFGERYLGERKPTAEGLRAYAEAHPGALAPEPRPIYLSPAVRP